MSYEVTDAVKLGTLVAAADLSAKQFYLIKVDSNGAAALCGDGEMAIGSLQNKPTSGLIAEIQTGGVAKIVAGAVTTRGGLLASDANGKVIDAVTNDNIVGIGLEAGADGSVISVFMLKNGKLDPASDPRTKRETVQLTVIGAITAVTEVGGGWEAPAAGAITRVCAYRKTAGSAGSTIVDVNIGGTTIFTTQANRPEIAYDDGDKKDVATTIEAGTLAQGDMVTMDVDQIDSAGSPADLSVILTIEYSA